MSPRPGRPRNLALAAGLLLAHVPLIHAEPGWRFEARLGGAWNVPLPVVVRQEGQEDLRWTAHWNTNAFEPPLYYGWRVTRWSEAVGWALDLTHHKLHLAVPPAELQNFAISHGYNLLTLQRLVERDGWMHGFGLGVVVAHPESEVRGQPFDEHGGLFAAGYYLTGPTAAAMLARSNLLWKRLHWTAELRLTLSHATVPIAGGDASVPNLAVHGTVGLGWIPR